MGSVNVGWWWVVLVVGVCGTVGVSVGWGVLCGWVVICVGGCGCVCVWMCGGGGVGVWMWGVWVCVGACVGVCGGVCVWYECLHCNRCGGESAFRIAASLIHAVFFARRFYIFLKDGVRKDEYYVITIIVLITFLYVALRSCCKELKLWSTIVHYNT